MADMSRNSGELKCPNCGGVLEVESLENRIVCPYCDSEFEAVTDDDAKVELIKFRTLMENEQEEKEYGRKIREKVESERRSREFKGSRLGKVMLAIAVISVLACISSISSGEILKGIIAGIQSVCFVMAYLIGSEKMKESFTNQYAACIIAGLILIVPVLCMGDSDLSPKYENIEWDSLAMSSMLPEPDSMKGDVVIDSEDELDISIGKTGSDGYKSYVRKCQAMGYTEEVESSDNSFEAFSSDGYKLVLYYSESSEELDIDLSAPMKLGEIRWPNNGPAALLPDPGKSTGDITDDSSLSFTAYIGDMDKAEFNDYVEKCKDKGFTKDYDKGDKTFSASDSDGAEVWVEYRGNSIVYVSIDVPEEKKESASEKKGSGKVSEDFKETMDDYEDFFDEYVDFMNSYDASDLSMLTEYASMMSKYSEVMDDMDDIDEDELSDADYAYYIKVMGRITEKLAEVE